jgi:hypothetical protein
LIVGEALTDGNADDAKTALGFLDEIAGDMARVTADAAYDTLAIYDASAARGAGVVVPPSKSATRSLVTDFVRAIPSRKQRRW